MNKKLIIMLAGLGIALGAPLTASATPESDLKEFQDFILKKYIRGVCRKIRVTIDGILQIADMVKQILADNQHDMEDNFILELLDYGSETFLFYTELTVSRLS